MNEVIKEIDCIILCGHRGKEAQEKAYNEGRSKAKFGESKHNNYPSRAVDVAPFPLDWSDIASFEALGRIIQDTAERLGIKVKWGRDFSNLKDYPHWELIDNDK